MKILKGPKYTDLEEIPPGHQHNPSINESTGPFSNSIHSRALSPLGEHKSTHDVEKKWISALP